MKPSSGWALFGLVLIGLAYWMVFSGRHSEAPPEFAALEMTKADIPNTPSCYSLKTVLDANALAAGEGDESVVWTMRVRDEWHLRLERGRAWREFWFVREGGVVVPFQYITSNDADKTTLQVAIDALLANAESKGTPKVTRCARTP